MNINSVLEPVRLIVLVAAVSTLFTASSRAETNKTNLSKGHDVTWARGIEGQRQADLGNGTYLNPIVSGDHPDPSVLKDGDDYYMVFSTFDSYPGLVIRHSKDLVNWEPVVAALRKNVGSVWAPDLVKVKGRYYIYFPARGSNFAIWADDIKGPWSDPIDLKVGNIDPGHAVGPDGKRHLFFSGGQMVQLSDDGLSIEGPVKSVYSGWNYPSDWVVEGFALESPKIVKHGDYYYLTVAQGGTAGPPTSHMVVSARSKSLEGPWENSPHNPIVRTRSRDEKWWSKGHGTLFEGPGGKWYLIYHAYENGYYTLGRQTLLEPVEWTADGWFKSAGHDVSKPIPKPAGASVKNGCALSDDFSTNKMGIQWGFYRGGVSDSERFRYDNGSLVIQGKGSSPKDCSPLAFVAGDQAYQVEVEVEVSDDARAGLILFYNDKFYAGLGFDKNRFVFHRRGTDQEQSRKAGTKLFLRLVNDHQTVSVFTSTDGENWSLFPRGMEVSGYHHNVAGGFLSLKPALYVAGQGEARFRNFKYQALP